MGGALLRLAAERTRPRSGAEAAGELRFGRRIEADDGASLLAEGAVRVAEQGAAA